MGMICDILFNEQEIGVEGYVCVYCDTYIPADHMRYVLNGTPRSNRTATGSEEGISPHEPRCPYCDGHKTGMRVKIRRDKVELCDYHMVPRPPRKPAEWTKKGGKWVRPVEFLTTDEWRIKSYVAGYKKVFRHGEVTKKPIFKKKTKAELAKLNTGTNGKPISNNPLNFWKMLGHVTNIKVVPFENRMAGYWKAKEMSDRLSKTISLRTLSRVSKAAELLCDEFGELTIMRADLKKIISYGAGLVAVYTAGVYHGERSGWVKSGKKNDKGKFEYINIDEWKEKLDTYHDGELSMDRGRMTMKENKRRALRNARSYLDGEGTVSDVVDGIFAASIDEVVDDLDREVVYIDEMDTNRSAKPHAE